jgi:hypothetical protein
MSNLEHNIEYLYDNAHANLEDKEEIIKCVKKANEIIEFLLELLEECD